MAICGKWKVDPTTRGWVYLENKDRHWDMQWSGGVPHIAECIHTTVPAGVAGQKNFRRSLRPVPPPLIPKLELTSSNSRYQVRTKQAEILEKEGYDGPVKGGEVIALRNLLTKLGKPDLIVRGWQIVRKSHPRWSWVVRITLKGPVYLFKSPIPGLNFQDFIMLARMYKDGKNLKHAVTQLLGRIPEELKNEAETFRTVDVLAGLGEGGKA